MLNIGVIGAGKFAEAHVQAIAGLSARGKLLAFARRETEKPFPAAESLGAVSMSVEKIIAAPNVHAIIICVPNHLHSPYVEAALRAGKHVFCEKPLAMTVADAETLIRTAEQSDLILMAGHLTRHVPLYTKTGELLDAGAIGSPLAMYVQRMHCRPEHSWRMDPRMGGGAVFDLLVHDLDLINWFLGVPRSAVARGRRHSQGAYDYVSAILSYEDHRIAVIEGGFVLRPPAGLRSMLRIVGERGHIEVDTTNFETPVLLFEENRPARSISVPVQNILIESLQSELNEFLDAVEGVAPRRLMIADARAAVACASALIEAADCGLEVAIR